MRRLWRDSLVWAFAARRCDKYRNLAFWPKFIILTLKFQKSGWKNPSELTVFIRGFFSSITMSPLFSLHLLFRMERRSSSFIIGVNFMVFSASSTAFCNRVPSISVQSWSSSLLILKHSTDLSIRYLMSLYALNVYSTCKTCLKRPLETDKTKVLMENGSLMKVESIAENILQYFWPALSNSQLWLHFEWSLNRFVPIPESFGNYHICAKASFKRHCWLIQLAYTSKKEGKDQISIQSSITPDLGQRIGK